MYPDLDPPVETIVGIGLYTDRLYFLEDCDSGHKQYGWFRDVYRVEWEKSPKSNTQSLSALLKVLYFIR